MLALSSQDTGSSSCFTQAKQAVLYTLPIKVAEREERDNFATCRTLSDQLGWTCVLLPRSLEHNVKSADMMRADDLSYWEIKTSYSANPKTINRSLQDAKKQSCNAIVHIVSPVCDMKAIKRAAALRKRFSHLENVLLIQGLQTSRKNHPCLNKTAHLLPVRRAVNGGLSAPYGTTFAISPTGALIRSLSVYPIAIQKSMCFALSFLCGVST